jgi:DNA repair exonuclease SbcCD ATPase subunit
MDLTGLRKKIDQLQALRKQHTHSIKEERANLKKIKQKAQDLTEASNVVNDLARAVQRKVHRQIGGVVTRCLEAVFDEPYRFQIQFERKRGKTESKLVFRKGDYEIDPREDECGGGVLDVTAFALRLACLLVLRPQPRRLLVLDEPAKMLSVEYRGRFRGLLESLAKDFGVQIIMVTHSKQLRCGKVVELS